MSDLPIIYSGPMVRAQLEGRKTQTRRLLRELRRFGRVTEFGQSDTRGYDWHFRDKQKRWHDLRHASLQHFLPFAAGDRLWVREAWSHKGVGVWTVASARSAGVGGVVYAADGARPDIKYWPSIHMPREFSRVTLLVDDVKVERLGDISEADAIAEGATCRPECCGFQNRAPGWSMDWSRIGQRSRWAREGLSESDIALGSAVSAFANFINELHDPRWYMKGDGLFGANPWVVVPTFRVICQNIDAITAVAA